MSPECFNSLIYNYLYVIERVYLTRFGGMVISNPINELKWWICFLFDEYDIYVTRCQICEN